MNIPGSFRSFIERSLPGRSVLDICAEDTSSDLHLSPDERNDRIEFKLLMQATSNVKSMLLINLATSLCAALVLHRNLSPYATFWILGVLGLAVMRWYAYTKLCRTLQATPPAQSELKAFYKRWSRIYVLGLILSAMSWIIALQFAVQINDESKFTVAVLIAALAGGATGVTAPLKSEGRAYICTLLLPAALVLANSSGTGPILAALSVMFCAVMLFSHNNNHKLMRNSLILQTANRRLINDLTALNTSLEVKVEDRTRDLEYAALRDPLTELPNRRGFRTVLQKQFERANRDNIRLAVGVIDLDGFKPVNDAFGHATGDQLLIEVGRRLQQSIGDIDSVARLGGDGFGFVISCPDELARLEEVGSEICRELADPYLLTGVVAEIGASVGLCIYPDDASSADDLCEKADYALYHAKQARKGTAVVFNADHEAEIRELANMEQVLRRANLDEELYVVFQPISDISDGKTYALEALARWHSPVLGNVPPDLFIRAAERSGFIVDVTRHLIRKALSAASAWPKHLRISINLSARDISSMDAVHAIIGIVQNSMIDPRRIDFEITETALVCDFEQAREALNTLHAAGTSIALDDFGTGHSSLSHIRLLPFDKLKVDSSFVADILTHQPSEDIVRTLIHLCQNMRIDCIIEGVETKGQLDRVTELGARHIQGFYLARPMEVDKIGPYLLEQQVRTANAKDAPSRPETKTSDLPDTASQYARSRSSAS